MNNLTRSMVVVFGKNGQVARALAELKPDWVFVSSHEANFLNPSEVISFLNRIKPTCVVNAAAYTQVDRAEQEKDICRQINAETPHYIADWCAKHKARLVHYSTDYVFDGQGERPWVENDQPNPINWYGETKLTSEKSIRNSGCDHIIFRVSWIYSDWGTNFVKTIERLSCERKELKVVADQWGSPTDARDIAKATLKAVLENVPSGTYHLCFSPYTNWYDFACQIVQKAKKRGLPVVTEKIIPISSGEYPTPAQRPKNSRLSTLYKGIFT